MLSWVRRSLITGFFVTVPLAISLVTIVWTFRRIDGLTSGVVERRLGFHLPGLGILAGLGILIIIGAIARNVFGRRVLGQAEHLFMQIPVFRTVYGPVKQLIAAFSPDNEYGFKQVVLVEDSVRGSVLGFLTKEFTVDRGHGTETMMAVYVPTNHLYLGDIVVCRPAHVTFPDMTVEQGIRVFLTGGMALPGAMRAGSDSGHRPEVDVHLKH